MVPHFQQQQQSLLPTSFSDALFCHEDRIDDAPPLLLVPASNDSQIQIQNDRNRTVVLGHDLLWDDDELLGRLRKEEEDQSSASSIYDAIDSDEDLKAARDGGIGWMMKVIAFYGFNAVTAALAVNYFDRFVVTPCFQKDKPWMGQLTAVACLSIAAKVEENHVPMLLDLQVEESKYLFEAKTIQRMELLVLSTLKWRMNPVTPLSFIDHIVRRFELMNNLSWDFLKRCEAVVLSIVANCKLGCHLPSVIAAATVMRVIREIGTCDVMEFQNKLMTVLRTSMEKVDDCYKLIVGTIGDVDANLTTCQKRKHVSVPSSPSGIIDAYFSSDSSVDSWASAPPPVSSPKVPLFKRSKLQ